MKRYEITWYPQVGVGGPGAHFVANHKWTVATDSFPSIRYADRTLSFQRADGRKVIAVGGSFVVEELI